ncbi:hypothetical protein J3R30DRAFT_1794162 [Lentinula aciculospora]|uniref:Uncharacterized protein n=1 Tax=Lentinula aciculospora TaxID=153920 RepID=A0A9W9AJZ5_9AGAR|nr:hypothetical protein J3R30DRAFT_1794162 [Lentinula aciculospora]
MSWLATVLTERSSFNALLWFCLAPIQYLSVYAVRLLAPVRSSNLPYRKTLKRQDCGLFPTRKSSKSGHNSSQSTGEYTDYTGINPTKFQPSPVHKTYLNFHLVANPLKSLKRIGERYHRSSSSLSWVVGLCWVNDVNSDAFQWKLEYAKNFELFTVSLRRVDV